MADHVTIPMQVRAVDLAVRCTRILSLDMIWTGQMGRVGDDDVAREELARVADEMASEISALRGEVIFVKEFAGHAIEGWDVETRQYLEPLTHSVVESARYINERGENTVADLRAKAEELRRGGVPEGDLPRRMWGAIATAAGFLMMAGGATCEMATGPETMPLTSVADTVGAGLFGAGIVVLMEKSERRPEE